MTETKAFSKNNKMLLYLILYTIFIILHFALDILFMGEGVLSATSLIRDIICIIFAITLLILFKKEQSNYSIDKNTKRWSVYFVLAIVYYFIFNIYLITMSIINAIMYGISAAYPQIILQVIYAITILQVILSIALFIYGIKLLRSFSKRQKKYIAKIKKYRLFLMIHIFVSVSIKFIGEFSDGFNLKDIFIASDGGITILIAILVTLLIINYLNTSSTVKNTFKN